MASRLPCCSASRILLLLLLVGGSFRTSSAAPLTKPELEIKIDFDSGSGKVAEIDQQQRLIRIDPTPHENRGWACWWYFHVTGVVPGEMITIDVGDAPWATPQRAAYSLNNKQWKQTSKGKRDGKRIVYRQQVDGDQAWFAWGPPFTPQHAKQLIQRAVRNCPDAKALTLCQTRGGRDVPAVAIGAESDRNRGVWVQARQHAWESGSSWVCQGFTEWLVSDDSRAKSLREQAAIYIVPIMDVDNVVLGAGGKNQHPHDHNRDWSNRPHWNSVAAAIEEIKKLDDAGRFDLFLDLHNPGANTRNPFYYVAPQDLMAESGRKNLQSFVAISGQEMTGPLAFLGHIEESGPSYDKAWERISKNWVMNNCADHVVAVTLETAWNTPHSTMRGYRDVGRRLGWAVERYLRETPRD